MARAEGHELRHVLAQALSIGRGSDFPEDFGGGRFEGIHRTGQHTQHQGVEQTFH